MVDTGAAQFAFDSKGHGGLTSLKAAGKLLIETGTTPPAFGTLLESTTYDGRGDFVPDAKLLPGTYRLRSFDHKTRGNAFTVTTAAELTWPDGDAILADLVWTARAGAPGLTLRATFTPKGTFRNRFVRELGIDMPLALNMRKRIVQGGDQGWQFSTRHYYQFHLGTSMKLMPEPEHNWWRYFMVEQDSPTHFRLWRSESADTSSLQLQHGRHAPGWLAAYDEQGGVLWSYRGMHERSPKAVAIDAEDGGRARVYIHPPTAPAVAVLSAPAEKALFAGDHRTDWIAFAGEFDAARTTRVLAQAWGEKQLASDPPARPRVFDARFPTAPEAKGEAVPLVSGGLPLPKGAIDQPRQVRLFKGNREVPLQAKPLAFWPDRSIKWLLLTFPQDGSGQLRTKAGAGEGEKLDFRVTLRGDRNEPFRLTYGRRVSAGTVRSALAATQNGDTVRIDTGILRLTLSTGRNWLRDVALNGVPQFRRGASAPLSSVDFLRTAETYRVNTAHPTGTPDPGPVEMESIVLEENGPLRAVVRMEGYARCKEPARVIVRVEACAGRSALRVFHTVEFLHKDPRAAFVRSMGLSLPLGVSRRAGRLIAGLQDGPKVLAEAERSGLQQRSHAGYTLWQQHAGTRCVDGVEHGERSRGWLSWTDQRGGCTVVLRNMWQEFPKELAVDAAKGTFEIGLWPASHPLMDVRRYSNYPHNSQGESTRPTVTWVDKVYYPNDPFVGVSKTHEMLLYFHDSKTTAEQLDAVAADFQSPGLVYVTPEYYAGLGITHPYPAPDPKRFGRMDRNLENVAEFWLYHQKIWAWYGMWDYGDVRHKFGPGGYGWILSPNDLQAALKLPEAQRYTTHHGRTCKSDYVASQDWAFDNGRWGWGNTEGMPGLFLQMQYLRTGRRDLFFAVEAMARHTRDVDMRHDGKWFGRGTRHGVQHWSCGNHEERQTVHSEWRFHHYLTGEMRSRDFSKQLTERHYTKRNIGDHASHSGRLYGLLTRWEMTGEAAIGEILRKYVRCFLTPEGIDISAPVAFPEVKRNGRPRDVNGDSMFFHNFGGMSALLEYYELTRDPELEAALIRMADHAMKDAPRLKYTMRKVLAFAAMHAKDPVLYRQELERWQLSGSQEHLFNLVSDNRKHWTGETAYMRYNVVGQWFWLNDALYLMACIGREPEIKPDQLETFTRDNRDGKRKSVDLGSWQSGYDSPELAEYLRDRRRKAVVATKNPGPAATSGEKAQKRSVKAVGKTRPLDAFAADLAAIRRAARGADFETAIAACTELLVANLESEGFEALRAFADGLAAGAQLKETIILRSLASQPMVYVEVGPWPQRVKLVGASNRGVRVDVKGTVMPIVWRGLSPRRFYGIATKFVDDTAASHLALAQYCATMGLRDEARNELARVGADLAGDAQRVRALID